MAGPLTTEVSSLFDALAHMESDIASALDTLADGIKCGAIPPDAAADILATVSGVLRDSAGRFRAQAQEAG